MELLPGRIYPTWPNINKIRTVGASFSRHWADQIGSSGPAQPEDYHQARNQRRVSQPTGDSSLTSGSIGIDPKPLVWLSSGNHLGQMILATRDGTESQSQGQFVVKPTSMANASDKTREYLWQKQD